MLVAWLTVKVQLVMVGEERPSLARPPPLSALLRAKTQLTSAGEQSKSLYMPPPLPSQWLSRNEQSMNGGWVIRSLLTAPPRARE